MLEPPLHRKVGLPSPPPPTLSSSLQTHLSSVHKSPTALNPQRTPTTDQQSMSLGHHILPQRESMMPFIALAPFHQLTIVSISPLPSQATPPTWRLPRRPRLLMSVCLLLQTLLSRTLPRLRLRRSVMSPLRHPPHRSPISSTHRPTQHLSPIPPGLPSSPTQLHPRCKPQPRDLSNMDIDPLSPQEMRTRHTPLSWPSTGEQLIHLWLMPTNKMAKCTRFLLGKFGSNKELAVLLQQVFLYFICLRVSFWVDHISTT